MAMFLKAFDRTKCFHGVHGESRRLRRRTALKTCLSQAIGRHEENMKKNTDDSDTSLATDRGSSRSGRVQGDHVFTSVEHSRARIDDEEDGQEDSQFLDGMITAIGRKVFDL